MRWKLGISVIIVCLSLIAFSGCTLVDAKYKYTGDETETKAFDLAGIETVEMRLGSADVEIISKDTGEATFIIKKTYRASEKEYGEKMLSEAEITIEREGSRLILRRGKAKQRGWDMLVKGYVSFDITATIPADIALDMLTGSGDLEIDERTAHISIRSGSGDVIAEAAGGLDASSGSGDMRLHRARGPVTFSAGSGCIYAGRIDGDFTGSTGSGDINVDEVTGDAEISSGSGDISVDSSEGMLWAKSSSGDIEIGMHAASAEIWTSSGDVELTSTADQGEVTVQTSSGDVDVAIHDTESVELDISTSTGTIDTKVPIVVKEASRRRLRGVSGEGRLKLEISTLSGDVSVKRGSI
jgi:hypothetical protein